MIYSLVKNDKVVNRIVADTKAVADEIAAQSRCTVTTAKNAHRGFELVGGRWTDVRTQKKKAVDLNLLSEVEKGKLIDMLEANGVITTERAAEIKS